MKTIAARIAEKFHNDGRRWENNDGVKIANVCESLGGIDQNWDKELTLYTFEDGSRILFTNDFWTDEEKYIDEAWDQDQK